MCSERKCEEKKPRHRKDLARQQRGCEARIILSQVWSVYFIQMMKTPSRDRRLICDDDSESIRSTAKADMHQSAGWTMSYWLDLLAAQIKSWVTAIGGRWSAVISRPHCQEALLCESCISLQTTHTHWLLLCRAPGRKSLKLISSLCKTIMAKQIHSILISSVLFTAWPHSLMFSLNMLCSCMPVCLCVCAVNV